LETTRWFLWGTFVAFPTGFVAVLCGWFTAEVGRQPWVVYGVLRTSDALSPSLGVGEAVTTLIVFVSVYLAIFLAGTFYIYRLLRRGPAVAAATLPRDGNPSRPLSLVRDGTTSPLAPEETGHG
jgi:cytochrome d ubiquinol oxidase subunit I